MKRVLSQFRMFVAAIVACAVLALLVPTRLQWWASDLAAIVSLPAVPFADAGTRARVWLTVRDRGLVADRARMEHLEKELDRFRVLYQAELQRNRALADLIAHYEQARELGGDAAFRPVAASIAGRNSAGDTEVYQLNSGARRGIEKGAVAVYNGSHLIGRISDVANLTSTLVPITEPAAGFIQGTIAVSDDSAQRNDPAAPGPVRTLLRGAGDGTLRGEVDTHAGVRTGDLVYLDDPDWPPTARAMIIGKVAAIDPKPQTALRVRITVAPRYRASEVTTVTVKLESSEGSGRDLRLGDAQ